MSKKVRKQIEFATSEDINNLPKEDLYWFQIGILDFIFDLKMKLQKAKDDIKAIEIQNAINKLINFSLEIEFKMIQLGI